MALKTIAVLSLGEMGAGVARLLTAHNYRVLTNCSGRSAATVNRANAAGAHLLPTDEDVVLQADCVLSIVPPAQALDTAKRVVTALETSKRLHKLVYIDLNAVAPATAREVEALLKTAPLAMPVDGGIIGGPPDLVEGKWKKPSIVVSGPTDIASLPGGSDLAEVLNLRHIADTIGPATGLKCCYASLTKGFTALAIQSLTTASRMGVLEDLQRELTPPARERAFGSVSRMQSKAYRWIREMQEISRCFAEEGGFMEEGDASMSMFLPAGEVFRFVSEDEVLGKNENGVRAKSTGAENTVAELAAAVDRKRKDRSYLEAPVVD